MPLPPDNATVLFVGGVEDGRVLKGEESQFFVVTLAQNADNTGFTASQAEIGKRVRVGGSRYREAMNFAGLDVVPRLYTKYGVNERQMHMNTYELKHIDSDVFVYEHSAE